MSWATKKAVTLLDLTTSFMRGTSLLPRLISRFDRGSSRSKIKVLTPRPGPKRIYVVARHLKGHLGICVPEI